MARRLALAAVVLALAGAGTVLLRPGSTGGPTSAAAAELQRLAAVAAAQPAASVPGPGQYLYVRSEESNMQTTFGGPTDTYSVLVPEERQIWIGADGSGRLVESFGQPVFLSAADHAGWVAAGSPSLAEAPSDDSFGPGGLSDGPTDLSKLPTDPAALGSMLFARKIEGGPAGAAEDFVQVGDLLRETDASPALRAALYQVAAHLPGVELLGQVTDHSGRPGIGIAYVSNGYSNELVLNPTTSALMGEQSSVVGATAPSQMATYPVGTVLGWTVYEASGVVDSTAASTAASTPAQ